MSFVAERRFPEAVAEMERGYDVSRVPVFLNGLAQAFTDWAQVETDPARAQAHRRRAVFEWRKYLKARPDAPDRADVNEKLGELMREIDAYTMRAQAATAAPAVAKPEPAGTSPDALARELLAERARHRKAMDALRRDLATQFAAERAMHGIELERLRRELDAATGRSESERTKQTAEIEALREKLRDAEATRDALKKENDELRRKGRDGDTARKGAEEQLARMRRQRPKSVWLNVAGAVMSTAGSALLAASLEEGVDRSKDVRNFILTNIVGAALLAAGIGLDIAGSLLLYVQP